MSFNIFTVYKSLYEEVPVAKKIADTKIALARQNYTITGPDDDIKTVREYFRRVKFDSMYNDIISDLVIYSNAFIERHSDGATILRHDPATSTIMTQLVRGDMISEEVVYMKTKDGREIPSGNLTHLAVNAFLTPSFGESPYGFWFTDWQSLKLIHQGKVKKSPEEITQIKQRIVERVIIGAGMDPGLFDDASPLRPGTISLLKMDAQSIQGEIIDKIERQIIPFILKSDPTDIPQDLRFQIEGYEV